MIRVERLRSDGSPERGDLVATDTGVVYIFPAEVPASERRTGRGWYPHRVGYIVYECDLSWTVRNIGNRIIHDLIDDRLDALATIAASEGFRITALGRPDRLVDMKLPVTLIVHERPRRFATLSTTSGKVFLFPERVPAKQRRVGAGSGELFLGRVRRTVRGWDIELESGERGETERESRVDAVHDLVQLCASMREPASSPEPAAAPSPKPETACVSLDTQPEATPMPDMPRRGNDSTRVVAPLAYRAAARSTRPLQSMYA
ncbi:hypothetical protein [Okibacterium fritillariae]|uniref:Uncharacterized protein n=1 Tax=Okibacterium fritillariae TaxID=123320 RepID=A0A1T5IUA3_9MICO|nr:hypothetical protein [Okibacterium fritillariae]SKC42503.1 hypothetical protein SAMN06309945_0836 [Okibacterium fritillariae]